MSNLQTTLETAIAEYNKKAEALAQLQQELLMRQGAIQQLQSLISSQNEDEKSEAEVD